MGDERASIEISVRDPRTAEVRVVAPDRPALMRDIARALTKEGFFIDSATISTKDGDVADNVFVIKLISDAASMTSFVDEKGLACQTMLGRVETLVVEAAMDAWGITTPDTVAYLAPEDVKSRAVGDGDDGGELVNEESQMRDGERDVYRSRRAARGDHRRAARYRLRHHLRHRADQGGDRV
jgi:hypothetical protein